jgi:hypothetical protein
MPQKGKIQTRMGSSTKSNRREWDEQIVRSCMYLVDAGEVLKIRLTERGDEDFNAWQYEKNEIFLVRSAYRIALEQEQGSRR